MTAPKGWGYTKIQKRLVHFAGSLEMTAPKGWGYTKNGKSFVKVEESRNDCPKGLGLYSLK